MGAISRFDDWDQSIAERMELRDTKTCDIFWRWDQDKRGRGTQQLTSYCRFVGESERQVLKDGGEGKICTNPTCFIGTSNQWVLLVDLRTGTITELEEVGEE